MSGRGIVRLGRPTLAALTLAGLVSLAVTPAARGADPAMQTFPDVLSARVTARGNGVYDFDVTVSSPYDTPQRYADAFRVTGPAGAIYGERILDHDHASEQPFTRDLHGVKVPSGIGTVTIQGRDKVHGYGGTALDLALPQH